MKFIKKINIEFLLLVPTIVLILYSLRKWFTFQKLSAGDWIYLFPESYAQITPFAAWDWRNFGLGSTTVPTLWLEAYTSFTAQFLPYIPWELYERVFWFFPFLIFSILSTFYLSHFLFRNKYQAIFSSLIYTFNTYSILLISGGQMGVALAYSFFPFVFLSLIKTTEGITLKRIIITGILLSILTMFDLRISYIFFVSAFILFLFKFLKREKFSFSALLGLTASVLLSFLIHFFWVLPLVLIGENPVSKFDDAYSSISAIRFFSFSFIENSISLLHPNWPENLFGKVYFMRSEFLILPIIAFSSLPFLVKEKNYIKSWIVYLVILCLVGIFLAKGSNNPFGFINEILYKYLPGFVMFRDPTKWYLLIALSYSILIPYSLGKIHDRITDLSKARLKTLSVGSFLALILLAYFLFLIRPFWSGQVKGTFNPAPIDKEYIDFKDYINSKATFFRVLWIPRPHRFSYKSSDTPAVFLNELFGVSSLDKNLRLFGDDETLRALQDASIKYVVVPIATSEKFLADSEFGPKDQTKIRKVLENTRWLRKVSGFNSLGVFEVPAPKSHFWIEKSDGSQISLTNFNRFSAFRYKVNLSTIQEKALLIFSEKYDKNWTAYYGNNEIIRSKPYKGLNSFIITDPSQTVVEIYYEPQDWVWIGLGISAITLTLSIILLGLRLKKW